MQRCTKCKRTYVDDKQKFCTYDGGKLALVTDAEPAAGSVSNSGAGSTNTDPVPPPQPFDPYKTIAAVPKANQTSDFYSKPTGPVDSNFSESQKTLVGVPPVGTRPSFGEKGNSGEFQSDPNQLTQPFNGPGPQPPAVSHELPLAWTAPPEPVPVPQPPPQQWSAPLPPVQQPPPPQQWTPPVPQPQEPPQRQSSSELRPEPPPQWTPPPHPPQDFQPQVSQQFQQPGGEGPAMQNQVLVGQQAPPVLTAPKKRSKVPLILGLLVLVLILGLGGLAAAFFFVVKPRLTKSPDKLTGVDKSPTVSINPATETVEPSPAASLEGTPAVTSDAPGSTTKFENSLADLDPSLAEHFVDFSFYYPNNWTLKAAPQGSSNFVEVDRRNSPEVFQENLVVSWYKSKGTLALDLPGLPNAVESMSAKFAKKIPNYQKVSEGKSEINSTEGYEFRFSGVTDDKGKGDLKIWGRVVFLPPGVEGEEHGVTLIMLATSLAPEVTRVEDVGESGQLALILRTFRLEH
jgi:hypothetical protein